MGIDLFTLNKDLTDEQIHPYFKILNNEKSFLPAKELLQFISSSFEDIDGNFVKSFQSNAFDQRFWELYIYCLLKEELFTIDRQYNYPDFVIIDNNKKVSFGLEVTSINQNKNLQQISTTNPFNTEETDVNDKILRWARLLDTKLTHTVKEDNIEKKYWELSYLKGKPFILAVNDFQGFMHMTWSFESLLHYCYGTDYNDNVHGELPKEIQEKLKKKLDKEISLRFFSQPEAENISAIILNPSGTLSKFNRMGKELKFGKNSIVIKCKKEFYNMEDGSFHTVEQYIGDDFSTNDVDEKFTDGLIVLKNPNAKYPIYDELFPESLQFSEENGHLKVFSSNKHCLYSCTQVNLH